MDTDSEATSFDIQVLGPFGVSRDGNPIDLGGKPALLVALLVASRGDVVSSDALIDGLWGDDPPATARKAVQVNVSHARRILGTGFPLETARGGYLITTDNIDVDADRFLAAVEHAADLIDDSPADATSTLADALALWQGTPYASFPDSEALRAPTVRLNEERLQAKRLLFDAGLRLGEHAQLVGELEAATVEHPYDEDLRRLHMVALYRSGRQTEALRAFDRTRLQLIDAGLDPSPALRDLYQQILDHDPRLDLRGSATPPAAAEPAAVGHAVRGYELRDPITESGDGTVYRAYQAAIGREVAIKVVPPAIANRAEFVKRFEAEARHVAQLEHPHIVPLYDYWRDPAGAYLVMQWPRAGSVADALATRRLEPPAVVRVLGQTGAALTYAHRQGVVHGHLGPASVLLDEDGNGYLADFSVASHARTAPLTYAAPEVVAGAPVDPRAEVYALTLLVNEMLTGTRPPLGAQLPSPEADDASDHLPAGLDHVLATGSAPDPDERYQRVDDLVRAVRQVLGADVTTNETAPPVDVRNPYKGLRAFGETDADDFFGRDDLIDLLTDRVASSRIVAVVGPSGCGKSSLVRAGLLPVVRQQGFGAGRDVVVAEMFPGSYPFEELEAALTRIAVHRPPTLLADLLADDRGLLRASKQVLPDDDTDLLLVIDQFEELFSLTADETVRRAFLDNLVAVANDERSRVRVVMTMRADFFDRPLAYPEFGEQISAALVTVAMPGHDDLAQAVAGPARQAGLELEAGLVSIITRDVADEPGALPLMQYALTELAEARTGRDLTIAAYEETGGVIGALATRAEDIYAALPEAAQAVAEELFVHLVAVDDDSDDTRRRVRRSELDTLGLNAAALQTVLADYGSFRLLTFDRDPVTRGQTVEVAHEALIREWPRYREWIDDRRESLIMQRRLQAAATEWEASDRDPGFLFTGGRLEHYEQWAKTPDARLSAGERTLLAESRTFENDRTRRDRSRRRRVLTLVCSLAAIAGVIAALAVVQQRRAEDATELAELQTLAATESAQVADLERLRAESVAQLTTNPPLAALLAAEAYAIDPTSVGAGPLQRVLAGVDGRQATLADGPGAYTIGGVQSADKNIVAVPNAEAIDVWDLDERRLILRIEGPASDTTMGLSADGTLLAHAASGSDRLDFVDVGSGEIIGTLDESICRVVGFSPASDQLMIVAQSPEDSATSSARCRPGPLVPGELQIWDVSDPTRPQLEHADPGPAVHDAWWAPDGAGYIAFAADGQVQFRDTVTHEPRWTHAFDPASGGLIVPAADALFRSDGGSVVIGSWFNERSGAFLFTFDTATGDVLGSPTSAANLWTMQWWDEDETQIIGTLGPSGVTFLDLDQAAEILPAPIQNRNATAVWVDRDRNRIVFASLFGVEVFSLDGSSVLERRVGFTDEQLAVKLATDGEIHEALSADGDRLLIAIQDPSVPIIEWDLTTDPPTKIGERPPGFALDLGDLALLFGFEGVQVLDGNHEPIGPVVGYELERGVPYRWWASNDGSKHAPLRDGTSVIDIYDTQTGERIDVGPLADGSEILQQGVSFGDDGAYMVQWVHTDAGERWAVYETATGAVLHSGESEVRSYPVLAGRTIYSTAPNSFDLVRRDVETLEVVGPPLVGHTRDLNMISDDLDSDRIVTQTTNANVRVWDRESGQQIGGEIALPRNQPGLHMTTARDGDLIVVTRDDEIAIWNYDIESWPALACAIAGRNMTQREWDDFGPQGAEYRITCPQFPPGN